MKVKALSAVLIGTAMAAGCSRGSNEARNAPPIPVVTAVAEVGSITAVVQATGLVTPAPGAEQVVTAPDFARIVELPKGTQEPVIRGDVLVRFTITSGQADAAAKQAEVAQAEARLESARAAHARLKDLFGRSLIPRVQVEEAEVQVAAAEAELRTVRTGAAVVDAAESSRNVVYAWFDGVVLQRFKDVGETVTSASPILTVVDPQRLEVTASMPVAEAFRINVGNAARLVPLPDDPQTVGLHVVARPESIVDRAAPVPVRLSFDVPPALAVGSPVQLVIAAETHDTAIVVPLAAVVRDAGDEAAVFVVNMGIVERRPVSIGITDTERAEITAGVESGEVVVIASQQTIAHGARVAPQ
jgi:cobalt-zinc-cadmium efflux system membrane fusion protein